MEALGDWRSHSADASRRVANILPVAPGFWSMTEDVWEWWGLVFGAGFLTVLFSFPTLYYDFLHFIGTLSIGIFLMALSMYRAKMRRGVSP